MLISITGTRQQMAELAHDIRMEGFRFECALKNPANPLEEQWMALSTEGCHLSYYKVTAFNEAYPEIYDKTLQAQLPSHRKHFLKQIRKSYERHERAI